MHYTNTMRRRDTYMFGGMAILAIAIGVLAFLSNGNGSTPVSSASPSAAAEARQTSTTTPSAVEVPFKELAHGSQSKVEVRANYLITSTAEFAKLWQMVDAKGKVPAVDFKKDSVVAVFAGQVKTGGYSISVSKVTDAQDRMVAITLTSPGSNCIVTQSTAEPYQILKLSKTSLSFTHEDQTKVTNCSD